MRTGRRPRSSWSWSGSGPCRRRWLCTAGRTRPASGPLWPAVSPDQTADRRVETRRALRRVLLSDPPPKKLVLSATVPQVFQFSTDTRVKASSCLDASQKEVDFVNQLRKPSSPVRSSDPPRTRGLRWSSSGFIKCPFLQVKARRRATIPKPFNLSAGHRKGEESGAYVPMAEQIQQFHNKTPKRYHLQSRRTQERGVSDQSAASFRCPLSCLSVHVWIHLFRL